MDVFVTSSAVNVSGVINEATRQSLLQVLARERDAQRDLLEQLVPMETIREECCKWLKDTVAAVLERGDVLLGRITTADELRQWQNQLWARQCTNETQVHVHVPEHSSQWTHVRFVLRVDGAS